MCSPFSCSSSFNNCDNLDELPTPIKLASKKPSKSRAWRSFSFSSSSSISSRRSTSERHSENKSSKKNPFADQGLEIFTALLADLEAKKQKIYTQKGSHDISLVYFTYSSTSDELQPFILKVQKPNQKPSTEINVHPIKEMIKKSQVEEAVLVNKDVPSRSIVDKNTGFRRHVPKNQRHVFSYFPVTIILILVLLLFGGRSFAVLCLTIAWYLVPTMLSRKTAAPPPKTNDRKSVSRSSTGISMFK